ncbi:MAG: aldo/keto reductase, partial [Chloroflexi bacterium]|nr:aldo/keto reductase [Chloroflexota bacterium]
MEYRRLGRTAHLSSVVTFGAAALSRVEQATADAALEFALDHGVNHIDVAPSYGDAELRIGPWMPRIRDRVFLGCKTAKRTKEEAAAELRRSLERLRVDRFDLYQLHAVGTLDDLDACTGPGGALEAIVEARAEGLLRWIGITGHGHRAPATHLEALRRFDFDTVMFPLNFILWSMEQFRADAERLLVEARARDVGVHILKTVASGPWGERPRTHTTWYVPFAEPEKVQNAV